MEEKRFNPKLSNAAIVMATTSRYFKTPFMEDILAYSKKCSLFRSLIGEDEADRLIKIVENESHEQAISNFVFCMEMIKHLTDLVLKGCDLSKYTTFEDIANLVVNELYLHIELKINPCTEPYIDWIKMTKQQKYHDRDLIPLMGNVRYGNSHQRNKDSDRRTKGSNQRTKGSRIRVWIDERNEGEDV